MQATPTTIENDMHHAIVELEVALTTPLRWINTMR